MLSLASACCVVDTDVRSGFCSLTDALPGNNACARGTDCCGHERCSADHSDIADGNFIQEFLGYEGGLAPVGALDVVALTPNYARIRMGLEDWEGTNDDSAPEHMSWAGFVDDGFTHRTFLLTQDLKQRGHTAVNIPRTLRCGERDFVTHSTSRGQCHCRSMCSVGEWSAQGIFEYTVLTEGAVGHSYGDRGGWLGNDLFGLDANERSDAGGPAVKLCAKMSDRTRLDGSLPEDVRLVRRFVLSAMVVAGLIDGRISGDEAMPFLIDGHNVIAAIDDIDLEDPDDEAKLVVRLRAWAARERRRAIVVFDGGLPGGLSRELSTPQVRVVFASRQHSNADRIIRERLGQLKDPRNWTVVTSDREILDEARQVGARVMRAADFALWLERAPVVRAKPETISAAEVNAWLEVFRDEEAVSATPQPTVSTPSSPGASPRHRPVAPPRKRSKSRKLTPPRYTRTIGRQVGFPLPAQRKDSVTLPEEKPSDVSEDEVNAWLQVFHDDSTSHIPPPKVRRRRASSSTRKEPVIRKHGELTPEETEVWLQLFEESTTTKEPEQAEPSGKRTQRGHTGTSKLARLKADLPSLSEEEARPDSLSDEDLALWRRLFGEGE